MNIKDKSFIPQEPSHPCHYGEECSCNKHANGDFSNNPTLATEIREGLSCPMSKGAILEYKKVGITHIYTCTDCPFLGLEFFTSENLKDLTEYLK